MNDMEIACFLSVARTGSFTVSARELSSTQQAVSRNIQTLERELGFPLLHRSGSGVSLTWAGKRFLQWRTEYDAQLSTLERRSRRLTSEGMNELYVAWNDWTNCPRGLDLCIEGFRRAYPAVQLHTRQGSTEEVVEMLLNGNADIAVLPEHCAHNAKGLMVSPPYVSLPLCVVSRDMDTLPPLSELARMRYLVASMGEESEEAARRRARMFCAELGFAPVVLEIMPNVRSTFTELLCGGCFTIAPDAEADGLCSVPLTGQYMRLVFVTAQNNVSPWVSLFESYAQQREQEADTSTTHD